MRCLWLTRHVPCPPFYGGDAIYTSRLIRALADWGVEVTTTCYGNGGPVGDAPPSSERLRWNVLPQPDRSRWRTVLSQNPSIARRFESAEFVSCLRRELGHSHWDAIAIDHIGMGWILEPLSQLVAGRGDCPVVIYVSHNHEETSRRMVARNYRGNPIAKAVLDRESSKVGRLERRLVRAVDLVTVNTEQDEAEFRSGHPESRFLCLPPGYDGPIASHREISQQTPRRVTVLGSFGWLGKRMNLEDFLRAAVPAFARAGAEIEILGHMPAAYAARIRKRFPSVLLSGTFEEAGPHLAKTRLGIVPEKTGGGFKHKVLSYVFCRVPIAALDGSIAGVPLEPGSSILCFPTLDSLVTGSLAALDDLPRLNQLQNAAFQACSGRFDWKDRGRTLADAIESFAPNPVEQQERWRVSR